MPRMGNSAPNRRTTATEIPASFGVQGPGEMTMRSGASRSMSAKVSSSLRRTVTLAPSSPRYCATL